MGFLERSRSFRRKDLGVQNRRVEQSPANQKTRASMSTMGYEIRRPSTGGGAGSGTQKGQIESLRPQTAGRASEREATALPPMPTADDIHSFKFPPPPAIIDSPRSSSSHSRNLTVHGNGSMAGLTLTASRRTAPEYKRSFTSPMQVPQASVQRGVVKMSTRELPKLEPTPAPSKKPTLHKSKSSTWRSIFQRKQSKPPVPDFDTTAYAPPVPQAGPVHKSTANVAKEKASADEPLPPPPRVNTHIRTQSRGAFRQTRRLELEQSFTGTPGTVEKALGISQKAPAPPASPVSTSPVDSSMSPMHIRPPLSRISTKRSTHSQQFYDAKSTNSSQVDLSPKATPAATKLLTPRLEVSIPGVELDRYSVMFEKLLQPKQTLLERRKTALQGLQLPGGDLASDQLVPTLLTPQRRATSPNLTCPSPLTAELIENSSQMATPVAMQRVSGVPWVLQRSKTAPPGSVSPARVQFQKKPMATRKASEQSSTIDNTSSACSTTHSVVWSERSVPQTPDTESETDTFVSLERDNGNDDKKKGEEEDDDDEDEEDDDDDDGEEAEIVSYDMKQLMPKLREPAWDMVSRTHVSATSSTATTAATKTKTMSTITTAAAAPPIPPKAPGRSRDVSKGSSREASSDRSDVHPPRTSSLETRASEGDRKPNPHPNPLQMHKVRRPIQISVAREVSVRRPPGGGAGGHNANSSPASGAAATVRPMPKYQPDAVAHHPAPVFSKQPLRPKVVEVRNRKSTLVVLDGSSPATSRESLPLPTRLS